jgi:integrase
MGAIMREGNKLTALAIARLKTPGRYSDGHGLYLQVSETGTKSWLFRYKKRDELGRDNSHWMGLGPLHTYSLQEARERARWARQLIGSQRDPLAEKRAAEAALTVSQLRAITFRQAALDFLATDRVGQFKNAKHRQQWHSTLALAFPAIGDLPLQSIDSALVLQALLPVWKRTPETGSRLRGRIERVFAWAKAHKLFDGENPASREVLRDALPTKAKTEHHKALPYADLPTFMERLRDRDSMSARCLEFTILTAARTQEAIGARWSEIDLDTAVWTIPAARMKAKRDHRVPLSHRAVEMLRATARNDDKVFPLSNMAMLNLIKGYTVHGFRSAFSDWARDRTNYPRDVVEMALAHAIKDKSEAAYRRGDALEKRRHLMSEWARYCESPAINADVVTLHG